MNTSDLSPDQRQRWSAALQLLAARRAREALEAFRPVAAARPGDAAARGFLGRLLAANGDLAAAAGELRAALEATPAADVAAAAHLDLGGILLKAGRSDEGETSLRAAVATAPAMTQARVALADHLAATGRAAEADALLRDLDEAAALKAHAAVLAALGRRDEVAARYRRVTELEPRNAVAWHNRAAAEGDLLDHAAAEASTAMALSLGLKAPETLLVRARALAGLDRHAEAQAALEAALAARPAYMEAHRDLARLIWRRTGDIGQALQRLDRILAQQPGLDALVVERARLLRFSGDVAGADAALAAAAERPGAQPHVKTAAAQVAALVDPARAARYIDAAAAAAPGDDDILRTQGEIMLACGRSDRAAAIAEELLLRDPDDQANLAILTTAWRLAGDPRKEVLEDYEGLVRTYTIDAPAPWVSLEAYLADLRRSVEALHVTRAHPAGQSLRHGTQSEQNLLNSEDPAIAAFPRAVDGAIRAYIAALGEGSDPIRRRNTGGYRINGMWSVRLKAQGFHVDHLHPKGWISSACYIALPPAVDAGGREGWLKFGEPGVPTVPPLGPQRFVKPEPGLLALFPSYMWHGTVPFSGDSERLTIAFDIVPA